MRLAALGTEKKTWRFLFCFVFKDLPEWAKDQELPALPEMSIHKRLKQGSVQIMAALCLSKMGLMTINLLRRGLSGVRKGLDAPYGFQYVPRTCIVHATGKTSLSQVTQRPLQLCARGNSLHGTRKCISSRVPLSLPRILGVDQ